MAHFKLIILSALTVVGSALSAYAQTPAPENTYNVTITVQKITIDNTDSHSPKFDIRNVCQVNNSFLFADVRGTGRNNGDPKALQNNCQVSYLGRAFPVRMFAGGGAYLLNKSDRNSSRFSLMGFVSIGTAQASGWITSKSVPGNEAELTIETASASSPEAPKISESFKVTYTFYK